MKTFLIISLTVGLAAGLSLSLRAQDDPSDQKAPPAEPVIKADDGEVEGDGLRLNFRGASLDTVLNYLSEAAGFTIVLETEVRGKVDLWNHHPVTPDEAVTLLNQVLTKNGYAAIREGKTLTVVSAEEAKRRDIPVRRGSDPADIPKTSDIVTQIIPVRYINASQLIRDLSPLLPTRTTLTANEGGNSIIITDTTANIRRMAEIIKALDTSVASISTIKVYALKYADAKALATTIKELFQPDTGRGNERGRNPFSGFNPGAMMFGGGDSRSSSSSSDGRPGAGRISAVADERSNSLVVAAPDDLLPTIESLIEAVDTDVEDVTEIRVFRLKYSDPVEMANLLSSLFPDETRADAGRGSRFNPFSPFGRGGFDPRRAAAGGGGGDESERMKKQGRVLAVADQRTASVVVSASRDLMRQIEPMIEQLDSDPARKQKVYVYSLDNADVQEVETILRNLFENPNSRNNRTGTTQASPLTTRSQQTPTSPNSSQGIGGGGTGRNSRGSGLR